MLKNVVFGLSVVAGLLFGGSVVSADTVSYTIQPGDTLSQIAEDKGFFMDDIAALNNIDDVNVIYAGDVLVLNSDDVTTQDNDSQVEVINPDELDTTAKRNDNGEVADPDGAVSPVQNETATQTQDVQPAQIETSQQNTQSYGYNTTDNGLSLYADNNNDDQYFGNSVGDNGYMYDNSDKTESSSVVSVPDPDMFITPQHTVFYTSEAMPIAGDTSLDGSKVFNGYVWVLK